MDARVKKFFKGAVKFIPLALFLAAVLLSCLTAYYFAYHITDSDAASELVLGKLLSDQNKIISSDWCYATETKLFQNNLVYLLLFKIFTDWHFIRFLSILLFQAMLIGSYFYFSRQVKMGTKAFFLSASLMLLPLSDVYGRIVLYQNYYIYIIVYGFLIAGLFLSFLRHSGQNRVRQALRLAAMFLLVLMSSLGGVRQLPSTLLPLFFTVFFLNILRRRRAEPLSPANRQSVWLAGLAVVAGLAGIFANIQFLQPLYSGGESAAAPSVALLSIDNLRNLFVGYLNLFGYSEGANLFSAGGLVSLAGAFAAVILLVLSLTALLKKNNSWETAFALMMYPVAMALITLIFLLVTGYEIYARYYLPVFIWVFPFLGILLDWRGFSPRTVTVRQVIVALACICMAVCGLYGHLYYRDSDDRIPDAINGLNADLSSEERLQPVVDFLEEEGYEVGYATHWNANIVTEMTDGQIPMITIIRVYPEFVYTYRDWLTNKQYRELSFVEDKYIFMLFTREEADVFSGSELSAFAIPIYEDDYFTVFTFDFSTEVWEYLLAEAKAMNQTSVLKQLLPEGE